MVFICVYLRLFAFICVHFRLIYANLSATSSLHLSTAARLYTIHMAPASIMHCLSQTNRQAELIISPLIQFRLAIITSAIPSSAPATPNPDDPWDGGWSVDEGSVAVRVP
jgi:hypothetical protein